MKMRKTWIFFCVVVLALWLASTAVAQVQDDKWSEPFPLSSEDSDALWNGARLVADKYGNTHVFWAEQSYIDGQIAIEYRVFDGNWWSEPVDIFLVKSSTFGFLSDAFVDAQDNLHLAWTMGEKGPILYYRAPLQGARDVRNWQQIAQFNVSAFAADLVVDNEGGIHIAYSNVWGAESGIYMLSSFDDGLTWEQPLWVDPDIPPSYSPANVFLSIDEVTHKLHLTYKYEELTDDSETLSVVGKEIRHQYSEDNGRTWSYPTVIDVADESPGELRANDIAFFMNNDEGHIIWTGTEETRRDYRHTTDGGKTWSATSRIFGELHGSAGDTMVMDGSGHLHFLGQIRYPQGLWSIIWDGKEWLQPHLIYLIRRSSEEDYQGVHVHGVHAAVNRGNQLIVTFMNSPAELHNTIYGMYRVYDDVTAVPPAATPTATPLPQPTPTLDPVSVTEPTRIPTGNFDANAPFVDPNYGISPWVTVFPSVAIILIAVGVALVRRRR